MIKRLDGGVRGQLARTKMAVILVSAALVGCNGTARLRIPVPEDQELVVASLGEAQVTPYTVEPSVQPLALAPDLSNLEPDRRLADLTSAQREVLARNDFLVLPARAGHMYQLYDRPDTVPFVTADAVFDAWHILFADTLHRYERAVLLPSVIELATGAMARLLAYREEAPAELQPDIDAALLYWDGVLRYADPTRESLARLEPTPRARLAATGVLEQPNRLADDLDPSTLTPQSGYAGQYDQADLERYFRAVTCLTMARQPISSAGEARQAALISLAVWDDPAARAAWSRLERLVLLLAGEPEDLGIREVLSACRKTYGATATLRELTSGAKARRLLRELRTHPQPEVEDHLSDRGSGRAPRVTLRGLPPGLTARALAFDAVGDRGHRLPSGEDIAALLGSLPYRSDADERLLRPARERIDRVIASRARLHDITSAALATLAALSTMRGDGYPGYARSPAWTWAIANAQMAGWSEVEHDTFLYSKIATNAWSLLGTEDERFVGSVEPSPEFFARLADLVHRTRTAFSELGAFDDVVAIRRDRALGTVDLAATEQHFTELEALLVDLTRMAERVLADRSFDPHQQEVLASIGDTLARLSLESSGLSSPPMSSITRVHRGGDRELFVGTGEPLEILVVVPWRGRLCLARGALMSYHEFVDLPGTVITDRQWKEMTRVAPLDQLHGPWLAGRGVGVEPEVLEGYRPVFR